ncbi:NAD(P)-dependent oxidoreductase [Desulfonatronovibrio magnus]|uniref:NAD(P)-dependent oxidoreductase n=1 Tax=Desulfonatronovibrio magnus TaxID=698827 RepID=UPI0005EB5729|nr:SDR family oxidoreductase [Desulfonatronovibrio magnus]
MKLVVFGATGKTGKEVVRQALQKDFDITVFVRNPDKVLLRPANLTILQGDVLDQSAVSKAVQGQDAVISVLGAGIRKTDLRTKGTRNIVKAMQEHGVKRIVSQSSLGIGETIDNLSIMARYLCVPVFLKNALIDHAGQEELIMESELDWTIVRCAGLTSGPLTEKYQHGFTSKKSNIKGRISRADVAHFMLSQLKDSSYLNKTVSISY